MEVDGTNMAWPEVGDLEEVADGKGSGEGSPIKSPGFPKAAGVRLPVEGAQLQSDQTQPAQRPFVLPAEAQTEQGEVAPPRPLCPPAPGSFLGPRTLPREAGRDWGPS